VSSVICQLPLKIVDKQFKVLSVQAVLSIIAVSIIQNNIRHIGLYSRQVQIQVSRLLIFAGKKTVHKNIYFFFIRKRLKNLIFFSLLILLLKLSQDG
jgi:hypothetical protein